MVKFLFAKEKTRVRFPLSAQNQNEVIYLISKILNENAKGFGIVSRHSVVILSFPSLPSTPTPKEKVLTNY